MALDRLKEDRKFLRQNRPYTGRKVMFDGDSEPTWIPNKRVKSSYMYRRLNSRSGGGARRTYRRSSYRRRWRGRGGYFADLIGKAAGFAGTVAKPFGVGSTWGADAKKWGENQERNMFNYYMGSGAYGQNVDVTGPNQRMSQEVPMFAAGAAEGCTVISHKEYLMDIQSSTAFQLQLYGSVNPGVSTLFPWLSQVAQSYQQYRFRSLIFTFRSTSGNLSTTQALGEIVGAIQYNSYAPAFVNKQQMLAEVMSTSGAPSEDRMVPVECAPDQTLDGGLLYVRGTAAAATIQGDARLYDLCKFGLATQGQNTGGITLGELHVSYVVELYKPQLESSTINTGNCSRLTSTDYSNAAALGTLAPTYNGANVSVEPDGRTLLFNNIGVAQDYMLQFVWQSNLPQTDITIPGINVGNGLSIKMTWLNVAGAQLPYLVGSSTGLGVNQAWLSLTYCVKISGGTPQALPYFSFDTAGSLPVNGSRRLWVVVTPCNQLV